ncbi:helix-turn-helix transcriptional regulator [Streptomyces sp. NPDC047315]|uniref:AraC family transcriptional regulator n=1 Tax=Streptomyces sp. NPDC047315 TaxID=3155142 RepID=UPI0033F9F82F
MTTTLGTGAAVLKAVRFHVMSRSGHGERGAGLVVIGTFPMPAGTRFGRHTHRAHQLAWASRGTLTVHAQGRAWVLPTTRALWIPAEVPHEVVAASHSTMTSLYLDATPRTEVEGAAGPWAVPQPVEVTPLVAELIHYVNVDENEAGGRRIHAESRAHGEALLLALLEPVPVTTLDTPLPTDPRAAEVARALLDDPASPRTLAVWGRHVGASGRTLARLFLAETGMPFGRWRRLARLNAALPALAAGEPLNRVARAVGYETVSAFVAAFRRETGVTPGGYFKPRRPPRSG